MISLITFRLISLIIFLLILGVLITIHEFGHFIAAKRLGVRVEKFSLGFGRKILSKKRSGTEYSLNVIPLGGYVKLAGESLEECKGGRDEYLYKTHLQRALIIFFGPLLNYILGLLCFWLVFFVGHPGPQVGGLKDGFGAKDAGMQIGDRIIAVDGERIYFWEQMQNIILTKKTSELVKLSILRNSKRYIIDVKIKEQQLEGASGKKISIGLIGIIPQIKHSILESFLLSIEKTIGLNIMTYKGLWRIITGKLAVRESVTGFVGIYDITSKVVPSGIIAVLDLIAILSIGLAIFNLLPLPLLDGGHIFLIVVEKIRGRRLSLKAENIITRVGLTLIISLAILVTYNDILRLFGDKVYKLFK